MNKEGNSPIKDLRIEFIDCSDQDTILYYSDGSSVKPLDGFGVWEGPVSSKVAVKLLRLLGQAVSLYCPAIETLSLRGLTALSVSSALVRSDTLRRIDLTGLSFHAFPRPECFLRFLVVGAPALRELVLGALEGLSAEAVSRLLLEDTANPGTLRVDESCAGVMDAVTDIELCRVPHPLAEIEELSLAGCAGLTPSHLRALLTLPHLRALDVSGCRIREFPKPACKIPLETLRVRGMPHLLDSLHAHMRSGLLPSLEFVDARPVLRAAAAQAAQPLPIAREFGRRRCVLRTTAPSAAPRGE